MSIFSRDSQAWVAKYIAEQGGAINVVNTFHFLQQNTAISASGSSTIVLGGTNQLFLVDMYVGVRGNSQIAVDLNWTIIQVSAPRIAYTPVGPASIFVENVFIEGSFILNEIAGVAGNFDLAIAGHQLIYS